MLEVSSKQWDDAEINRLLALVKAREGDLPEAVRLIQRVIANGDDTLADHLFLAEWMLATGTLVDPAITVNRLLDDNDSTQAHVIAALRLLSRSKTTVPEDLDRKTAILNLSSIELRELLILSTQRERRQNLRLG